MPSGKMLESCTIVTTAANEFIKPIHGRMPVILRPENEEKWIDPEQQDTERISELLEPISPDLPKIFLKFLDIRFYKSYEQIVDLSDGIARPKWCSRHGSKETYADLTQYISETLPYVPFLYLNSLWHLSFLLPLLKFQWA